MEKISIKRIYEKPLETDGYRVLVDRLWPRGVSKSNAKLDEWNKEIAPSTELRKWFDHKDEHFVLFSKRYKEELLAKDKELARLRSISNIKPLTLLYGARDPKVNHATVLKDVLLLGDILFK